MSPGAALPHDGRRPRLTSPCSVNWLTTSTAPPVSITDRFITPASSAITLRLASLEATTSASSSVSPWATPTRASSPRPIRPTTAPSTRTSARLTRCTTTLIDPLHDDAANLPLPPSPTHPRRKGTVAIC